MTYDWADTSLQPGTLAWFNDQPARHDVAHSYSARLGGSFATSSVGRPFR